jgi:cell division transport system ATP-binding protein
MEVFRQFNQLGTTVIVASHDRELIESMGVRIIELAQGAIVRDSGAPAEGHRARGWPV